MPGRSPIHTPHPVDETGERDYSDPHGDHIEALSRDRMPVRTLTSADLDVVVRIDRKVTGGDRTEYLRMKIDEALGESAIRVSLIAEPDGLAAGFVMARVDFGEYGRAEPVAVIDTIGVDPAFAGQGVGRALLSQLMVNLAGLRVDTVEAHVARENFDLLGFLYRCGFVPAQRLIFAKTIN